MAITEVKVIRPQEGAQTKFMASPADIVIYGGMAGGGKTVGLLLEPLRHVDVAGFGGVIFRRTTPQIRLQGGLWDESMQLYPLLNAIPKESSLEWQFDKIKMKFSHLEYEKNILDWQGSQIPYIGFDELPHFTEKMFFYLLSRNRSTCGVKPYIRATCNPDPESWVAELISWWIDQETGFPVDERDGVIRYFTKNGDNYIWGDSKEEVIEQAPDYFEELMNAIDEENTEISAHDFIKSITFIKASIYENKELLKKDPSYLANLMAQDEASRNSLLLGNWKIVSTPGDIYDYADFLGMFENMFEVKSNERYITADIAGKGSNKFVVGAWYGKELMDILVMEKSTGPEVIAGITDMAKKHLVPNKNIIYDSDGIGGLIDGFIVGAVPFSGGATAIPVYNPTTRKDEKENYYNLKTQLVYRSGAAVSRHEYRVNDEVAIRMFDVKHTVRQRFIFERKAFKRDKVDSDGKLRIMPKEHMKTVLQNESPDLMDMFWLREYFELFRKIKPNTGSVAGAFG